MIGTHKDRGPPKLDYERIVQEALTEPGKLHERYTAFHNFSIGNQWLAMMQLPHPEPINTFPGWKALGRSVKKGEKAIELIMPVFRKAKEEATDDKQNGSMFFMPKRAWFGLHQTDGEEYVPTVPEFDIKRAAAELNITIEPFRQVDGNCQGYARTDERVIAVSSIAYDSLKTSCHEMLHVLLHSGITSIHGVKDIPKDVREAEAELGAYLLVSVLGHTKNLEYSRGYIQHYLQDGTKEAVRYQKVFAAVDSILKAGKEKPEAEQAPERPAANHSQSAMDLRA